MTTITTTTPRARTQERVVVETVTVQETNEVSLTIGTNRRGNPTVYFNGEPALVVTKSGHLLRLRGLTEAAGVRRLPDGRIAIRKTKPASRRS